MPKSRITFEVDQNRVEVIVGLLIKEVTDFQVTEVHATKLNGRKAAGQPSTKWMMGPGKAVLDFMKQKPAGTEFFYKDLGPAIVPCGMKASSITPVISELVRVGRIKKVRRGNYALA